MDCIQRNHDNMQDFIQGNHDNRAGYVQFGRRVGGWWHSPNLRRWQEIVHGLHAHLPSYLELKFMRVRYLKCNVLSAQI